MRNYGKFAAQVAAAIAVAVVAVLNGTDHQPGVSDWINCLIVVLGSVGVLCAGNLPAGVWSHAKSIFAAATAVAVLLQSVITDGISAAEWIQLGLAAAGALGVFAVKGPVVYGDALAAGRNQAGLRNGPAV